MRNDDPVREIEQFLYREARLLDDRRFHEWLTLFTEDISYRMIGRGNRYPRSSKAIAILDPKRYVEDEAAQEVELALLDENKESLSARATETGEYAMAKLRKLKKHNPMIGEVRGLGLMIGVELIKDEKLTPATSEADAIRDALLRQGVLVGVGGVYGNVIRFQPPLIIARPQIDRAIDAFATALQEVAQPAHV